MDGLLLAVDDVKDALGVDHEADDEHLANLISDGESLMTRFIGTTLLGTAHTELFDGRVSKFFLTHAPVKAGSVTITNLSTPEDATDDEVLAANEYRVGLQDGVIQKISSLGYGGRAVYFAPGERRWQVAYTAGLEYGEDWEEDQNALRASLRDLVVTLYNNPDPRISQERFGTGTGVSLDRAAVPERVLHTWENFQVDII